MSIFEALEFWSRIKPYHSTEFEHIISTGEDFRIAPGSREEWNAGRIQSIYALQATGLTKLANMAKEFNYVAVGPGGLIVRRPNEERIFDFVYDDNNEFIRYEEYVPNIKRAAVAGS